MMGGCFPFIKMVYVSAMYSVLEVRFLSQQFTIFASFFGFTVSCHGTQCERLYLTYDIQAFQLCVTYTMADEGRRLHDHVPPNNMVYEQIIFKAPDIKDLRVLTPAPQSRQHPHQHVGTHH
jgi:hypothetical protein